MQEVNPISVFFFKKISNFSVFLKKKNNNNNNNGVTSTKFHGSFGMIQVMFIHIYLQENLLENIVKILNLLLLMKVTVLQIR